MRIQLNGKPITGEGTADEPPPSMHVIRWLIGCRIVTVATQEQSVCIGFETRGGKDLYLTFGIELEPAPDGEAQEAQEEKGDPHEGP